MTEMQPFLQRDAPLPVVSYVVAAQNRPRELARLLDSISLSQVQAVHEVIVCAQSEEVAQLVRNEYPEAKLLVMEPCSLSHARNVGLGQITGEYICFPDDDCHYPPTATATALSRLVQDPELGFIVGVAQDPKTGVVWHGLPGQDPVDYSNVWRAAISFTFMARRRVMEAVGNFDERLGVGTRFGAGEETDYLIRALEAGFRGETHRSIVVFHEEKPHDAKRAYSYARGVGAVYRKHISGNGRSQFIRKSLLALAAPLLRCILNPIRMNRNCAVFRGRMYGFVRWTSEQQDK